LEQNVKPCIIVPKENGTTMQSLALSFQLNIPIHEFLIIKKLTSMKHNVHNRINKFISKQQSLGQHLSMDTPAYRKKFTFLVTYKGIINVSAFRDERLQP